MHYLDDVPQYRYKPPATLFGYPPENDANACYCVGPKCPHAGRCSYFAFIPYGKP